MEAILNLQPDTRSLVVISGSGLLDKGLEQNVRDALQTWQGRLQIEYWSGLPLERVLERVAALPPKTAILYTIFTADPHRTYRNPNVAQRISKTANAPVFGLYDTLLGKGIVGGSCRIMAMKQQEPFNWAWRSFAVSSRPNRSLSPPPRSFPCSTGNS